MKTKEAIMKTLSMKMHLCFALNIYGLSENWKGYILTAMYIHECDELLKRLNKLEKKKCQTKKLSKK